MMSITYLTASISGILAQRVITQSREDLPLCDRIKFSLRDLFLSLPHLAVRVRYIGLAIIVNCLFRCDFKSAYKNLKDLAITIAYDSLLTITGLVSLILSPCTNKVNQFNSRLNRYFLKHSTLLEVTPRLAKCCTCCLKPAITNIFLKII